MDPRIADDPAPPTEPPECPPAPAPPPSTPPAAPPESTPPGPAPERPTASVELLWDLVFVFAVTQVTTLLSHGPGWGRFGQAMLVLALVWWAWSGFVWAANAHDSDSELLRAHLLAATLLIFIVGLALPHAFGADGLLFAGAYVAVRLLHLSLYAGASRRGRAAGSAIAGFGVTALIGMAMLIAGALVGGALRDGLWALAVAIDYSGPAWLTRDRLRALQQVAVAHFAERYGDFVIICLGESVVSIGVGVGETGRRLTAGLLLAAALGLLIAIAMWWTYFDRIAERAQARLRRHHEPVLAAADGFSYLHLVIVAGIIIFAGGIKLVVRHSFTAPMSGPGRLAFCGGVAIYLLGVTAFQLRLLGRPSPGRVTVAVGLLALAAAGDGLPAWAITVIVAGLMTALSLLEYRGSAADDADDADEADDAGEADAADDPGDPAPATV